MTPYILADIFQLFEGKRTASIYRVKWFSTLNIEATCSQYLLGKTGKSTLYHVS